LEDTLSNWTTNSQCGVCGNKSTGTARIVRKGLPRYLLLSGRQNLKKKIERYLQVLVYRKREDTTESRTPRRSVRKTAVQFPAEYTKDLKIGNIYLLSLVLSLRAK